MSKKLHIDHDFSLDGLSGSMFGTTTTQKLAFFGSTPIVKPSGDIVTALSNLGLIDSPTGGGGSSVSSSWASSSISSSYSLTASYVLNGGSSISLLNKSGSYYITSSTEPSGYYQNDNSETLTYIYLPTASIGLNYSVNVVNNNGIRIIPCNVNRIQFALNQSILGGYLESTISGSFVELIGINNSIYMVKSSIGNWNLETS